MISQVFGEWSQRNFNLTLAPLLRMPTRTNLSRSLNCHLTCLVIGNILKSSHLPESSIEL